MVTEAFECMICPFIIITHFLQTERTIESISAPASYQNALSIASFAFPYWLWQNDFPASFTSLEHSMHPCLAWMCLGTHVSPAKPSEIGMAGAISFLDELTS